MTTIVDLFNCAGWRAINRIAPLVNIHNVFFQNAKELNELLEKIHNDVYISEDIQKEFFEHLQQRIFNYCAASSVLTDTARKVMKCYQDTIFYKEYEEEVLKLFVNNNQSHFVRSLRNYQTHYELPAASAVRSSEDNKHWDVVFISEELLRCKNEWNSGAKQFIKECGQEINLNKLFFEYTYTINIFYQWLYTKFQEHHKSDFIERNRLIEELDSHIPSLQLELLPIPPKKYADFLAKT